MIECTCIAFQILQITVISKIPYLLFLIIDHTYVHHVDFIMPLLNGFILIRAMNLLIIK